MDLNYSPADDAFRADIRAWLDANLPHASARPRYSITNV
jgi:hypothetical protein